MLDGYTRERAATPLAPPPTFRRTPVVGDAAKLALQLISRNKFLITAPRLRDLSDVATTLMMRDFPTFWLRGAQTPETRQEALRLFQASQRGALLFPLVMSTGWNVHANTLLVVGYDPHNAIDLFNVRQCENRLGHGTRSIYYLNCPVPPAEEF